MVKTDTNILSIDLGSLAQENFGLLEVNELDAAPPTCKGCSVVLSDNSTCVFCGASNSVAGSALQIRRPIEEYVLTRGAVEVKAAAEVRVAAADFVDLEDTGLTVFCIDVSGSSTSLPRSLPFPC